MSAIEEGSRPLGSHVLEILRTPWGDQRGKEIGRAVVNVLAPCVRSDELQPVREAPLDLGSQAVIDRVSPIREAVDDRTESRVGELLQDGRAAVDVFNGQGQRVEFRLRGPLQVGGERTLRIGASDHGQDALREEAHAARAQVADVHRIVVSDYVLDAEIPLDRIREVLVEDVGRGGPPSGLFVKFFGALVGSDAAVR